MSTKLKEADRLFIGCEVVTLENSLKATTKDYSEYLSFFKRDELEDVEKEIFRLNNWLRHFYDEFCPSVGLSFEDVEMLKKEYKEATVKNFIKSQSEKTLTKKDLFGPTYQSYKEK